jgi:hypothetical protein
MLLSQQSFRRILSELVNIELMNGKYVKEKGNNSYYLLFILYYYYIWQFQLFQSIINVILLYGYIVLLNQINVRATYYTYDYTVQYIYIKKNSIRWRKKTLNKFPTGINYKIYFVSNDKNNGHCRILNRKQVLIDYFLKWPSFNYAHNKINNIKWRNHSVITVPIDQLYEINILGLWHCDIVTFIIRSNIYSSLYIGK